MRYVLIFVDSSSIIIDFKFDCLIMNNEKKRFVKNTLGGTLKTWILLLNKFTGKITI